MSLTITTAWMLGCVTGFFMGATVAASQRRPTCRELMRDPARQPTFAELLMPVPRDRDPDWRRSFNHENTAPNSSEERPLKFRRSIRFDEGRVQRGNGTGGPTTNKPEIIPKPQPRGGRLIRLDRDPDKPEFPPPRVLREDLLP